MHTEDTHSACVYTHTYSSNECMFFLLHSSNFLDVIILCLTYCLSNIANLEFPNSRINFLNGDKHQQKTFNKTIQVQWHEIVSNRIGHSNFHLFNYYSSIILDRKKLQSEIIDSPQNIQISRIFKTFNIFEKNHEKIRKFECYEFMIAVVLRWKNFLLLNYETLLTSWFHALHCTNVFFSQVEFFYLS